jgi:hypothetical protein
MTLTDAHAFCRPSRSPTHCAGCSATSGAGTKAVGEAAFHGPNIDVQRSRTIAAREHELPLAPAALPHGAQ